jgi:hypothetical protein
LGYSAQDCFLTVIIAVSIPTTPVAITIAVTVIIVVSIPLAIIISLTETMVW